MTKENIHPVIQSRICCQDSRWMSEYWWSWKLHWVPFSTSLQWRMGWGEGRAYAGFPWRGTFLNIQNPSVLCRVSKADQSHFEAQGASFVCEGCEVLPKWLCQFFKTHLQLTLCASAFSVFGAQVRRHMIELKRLAHNKDLSTWKFYVLLNQTVILHILYLKIELGKNWTKSKKEIW